MGDFLQSCQDSRAVFEHVLACVNNALIVTDIEGTIVFASEVAGKMFGFEAGELEGAALRLLFTPEDRGTLYTNLLTMARKEEPFEGEILLQRKNGDRFFTSAVFRSLDQPGLGERNIIICIQDIHKHKQLSSGRTRGHYEDLVKMANGIAHELRNPLVGIGGFVNRLYKSCESRADRDTYYGYIINSLKKMEAFVQKVEYFAKLPTPALQQKSIPPILERVAQAYRKELKARGVDLTVETGPAVLFVDEAQMVKALSILLENASDAISSSGSIRLRVEQDGNQCSIEVSDTGSGISPEDLPLIFEPFFSTKPDAAGIELSVVKRILENHGGEVHVSSTPGEGTTFTMSVPVERRRSIRLSRL